MLGRQFLQNSLCLTLQKCQEVDNMFRLVSCSVVLMVVMSE